MTGRDGPRWPWSQTQTTGGVLVLVGLVVSIVLAVRGNSEDPPSAGTQGLFVLIAAVCQIGAAWTFSRVGRVDSSHPVRALRRLERLRERAASARQVAEALADNPTMILSDRKQALGKLSVWMSVVQEEVVEAMNDWAEAVPAALKEAAEHQKSTSEEGLDDD